MFTGIITNLGTVKKKTASRLNIQADAGLINQLDLGDSVAVNGVCLTVGKIFPKAAFEVDVMPETFKKTMLGALTPGAGVNLELPLSANGRFDGHVVEGHVDGTATIKSIKPSGNSHLFTFLAPKKLLDYMAEKGSVTINGISLTIINVTNKNFSVGIIPHTRKYTNLKSAEVGDKVNIELDILAKYIYKFISVGGGSASDGKQSLPMKNNKDIKIAIVSSSFRPEIADNMEKRCLATLREKGVEKKQVTMARVPGSLEIPLAVKKLAKQNIYDAIITFGAIYKGNTYHFEQIANECARGCMDVSLQYEVPVIFEVLAVYDPKDALERATRKVENKGVEAALSALTMIKLLAKL